MKPRGESLYAFQIKFNHILGWGPLTMAADHSDHFAVEVLKLTVVATAVRLSERKLLILIDNVDPVRRLESEAKRGGSARLGGYNFEPTRTTLCV